MDLWYVWILRICRTICCILGTYWRHSSHATEIPFVELAWIGGGPMKICIHPWRVHKLIKIFITWRWLDDHVVYCLSCLIRVSNTLQWSSSSLQWPPGQNWPAVFEILFNGWHGYLIIISNLNWLNGTCDIGCWTTSPQEKKNRRNFGPCSSRSHRDIKCLVRVAIGCGATIFHVTWQCWSEKLLASQLLHSWPPQFPEVQTNCEGILGNLYTIKQ